MAELEWQDALLYHAQKNKQYVDDKVREASIPSGGSGSGELSGSGIPQAQKVNLANAIRYELVFVSENHPFTDAFLAWLENGSDIPVNPPDVDSTSTGASYTNGVITLNGSENGVNFANGIINVF